MKPNQYFDNIKPKDSRRLDELLEQNKIYNMELDRHEGLMSANALLEQAGTEGDYWKFLLAADMYEDMGLNFTAGRCLEAAVEQSRYDFNKPKLEQDFHRALYGKDLKNPLERPEPVQEEQYVFSGVKLAAGVLRPFVRRFVKQKVENLAGYQNIQTGVQEPGVKIWGYIPRGDGGVRM